MSATIEKSAALPEQLEPLESFTILDRLVVMRNSVRRLAEMVEVIRKPGVQYTRKVGGMELLHRTMDNLFDTYPKKSSQWKKQGAGCKVIYDIIKEADKAPPQEKSPQYDTMRHALQVWNNTFNRSIGEFVTPPDTVSIPEQREDACITHMLGDFEQCVHTDAKFTAESTDDMVITYTGNRAIIDELVIRMLQIRAVCPDAFREHERKFFDTLAKLPGGTNALPYAENLRKLKSYELHAR